jgi:NADPH:quinone reductase-like Zn-dependent oxidoreductase
MRATASDPYGPLPALTEVPDPSSWRSILGADFAGVVGATGHGTTPFSVGDKVFGLW